MTYAPGRHVYLAAPFFNDQQRDLCEFIESFENPNLPIYSPRLDGGVLKPDSSDSERHEVFQSNCVSIEVSAWALAVVDDFDAGVIWEMGYGFARGTQILAYSDVPGRGLNVMLAGSCSLGFVNGRDDLSRILKSSWIWNDFPKNTWRGKIQ